MKTLLTLILSLLILAGAGAFALRHFRPEKWNAVADTVAGAVTNAVAQVKAEPPAAEPETDEPLPVEPPAEPLPTPTPEPPTATPETAEAGPQTIAKDGDFIGWGVVTATAATAYNREGKRVTEIPGGELFQLVKQVTANGKTAYYVELEQRKNKPRCALLGDDCRVFVGEVRVPGDVDGFVAMTAKRRLVRDYYSALAVRAKLLERARERHFAASPAKDLPKLKKQLAGVPAYDRSLEAAQKAAKSNAERLRYQDKRKELRYRTTGLREEIKRLEAAAAEWEKSHPFDSSAIQNGAVWKRLSANIEKLEPQIRALDAPTP